MSSFSLIVIVIILGVFTVPFIRRYQKKKKAQRVRTPLEWGTEVYELYRSGLIGIQEIQQLENITQEDIDHGVVRLKDKIVKQLVFLGHQYNSFSKSDQELAQTILNQSLATTSDDDPVFQNYLKTFERHPHLDEELESFRSITNYAFFDRLKIQNPEEAKRLGLSE